MNTQSLIVKLLVLLPLSAIVLFSGCDSSKRNVNISGRMSLGAPRAASGVPLQLLKDETVQIAIRIEGAGVWEKPNTMSCSLSAGQFEKVIHTTGLQDDPINANYEAPLTKEGRLVAADKRCGDMTATKIASIEKVELKARVETNSYRCQAYCQAKSPKRSVSAKCSQKCENAKYLVATPIVSSGAIEKLLTQAKSAQPNETTVGTGLELVFDSLSDVK